MSATVTPNEKYTDAESTSRGKRYTLGWDVVFSSGLSTEQMASECLVLADIPRPFMQHPVNWRATCTSVRPRRGEGPLHWVVVASYETGEAIVSGSSSSDAPNADLEPWEQPLRKTWRTETQMVECQKDITGKRICNSATESFNPPTMKQRSTLILTIEKAQIGWSASVAENFKDHVNSATFWGFAARTVLFGGVVATDAWFNGQGYVQLAYEFKIDTGGHKIRRLDEGFRRVFIEDGETVVEEIKDKNGSPVSQPALLDGLGQPLDYVLRDQPVFLEWDVYPTADFSQLGVS